MKSAVLLALSMLLLLKQSDSYRVKGDYKVVLDKEFAADVSSTKYIITFSDSTYIKSFKSGEKVKGKIKRMSNFIKASKTVYLDDIVEYTPQSHLDSLIHESFGEMRIEFEESKNDTLKFRTTYSGNLHVTVNEGKLIKIN